MKLIAYPTQGPDLTPPLKPAAQGRDWMDRLPAAYGYRCLPLTIANSHGWVIEAPVAFEAQWNGRGGKDAIEIRSEAPERIRHFATSHFGSGILTFHPGYLFRTDPGINLWVGGVPNWPKDAIYPLTGVIETDWSPYSFTMNWQFTRENRPVRFEAGEPVCFFFPVGRGMVEATEPEIRPLDDDLENLARYETWNASRRNFLAELPKAGSDASSERWQKGYYRGLQPDGSKGPGEHQTKVRPKPFRDGS